MEPGWAPSNPSQGPGTPEWGPQPRLGCWGAPRGQGAPYLCLIRSDITEEDLEEAGVLEPGHKRVLLESLQLRK